MLRKIAYLFTYNADAQGVTATIKTMTQAFSRINGIEENQWLLPELVPPAKTHGAFAADKGFYIWAGPDGKGTLEHVLVPLFKHRNAGLHRNAEKAIDTLFIWPLNDGDSSTQIAQQSKRAKAILTTMGQKKKPGGSLNVVLRQAKLVRAEDLKSNDAVQAFADFLRRFAGFIVTPNKETAAE